MLHIGTVTVFIVHLSGEDSGKFIVLNLSLYVTQTTVGFDCFQEKAEL